jgi:hypothetical protein
MPPSSSGVDGRLRTMFAVARLCTRCTVSTRSMSPVTSRMKARWSGVNSRSERSAMSSVRWPPNSVLNRS